MKKGICCFLASVLVSANCLSQDIDYDNYKLVFEDEFNYSSLADSGMITNWSYGPMDKDWSGGIEWFPEGDTSHLYILQDNLGNHYLRIRAERMKYPVPMPNTAHTSRLFWSGMIVSKTGNDPEACLLNGVPQTGYRYGLFEMRAKIPKGDPIGWDAWPAFWMRSMGAEIDIIDDITNDPGHIWHCGFIDWWNNPDYDSKPNRTKTYRWDVIATDSTAKDYNCGNEYNEGDVVNYSAYGSTKTYRANGTYPSTCFGNETILPEEYDLSEDFHLFGCEWTADSLTFFLDGKRLHANAFTPPFMESFQCAARILVNLSVMGTGNEENEHTDERMDMDIDYIRVWKRKP